MTLPALFAVLPLAFLDEALGPILLLLIWAARAIMSANAEAKRRRQNGDLEDEDDVPVEDDAIRSELEEFLRRVQGEPEPAGESPLDVNEPVTREAAMAEAPPRSGRAIEVFEDEPDPPPRRRPIDPFEEPTPRRYATAAAEAASAPAKPASPPETGVSAPAAAAVSSVQARHLPESQLAEHAAHLGESIMSADDRLQARLDAKFGKSMGTLDAEKKQASDKAKAAEEKSAAARVAAALASPTGVRDAVVLNEILQRPTDRW